MYVNLFINTLVYCFIRIYICIENSRTKRHADSQEKTTQTKNKGRRLDLNNIIELNISETSLKHIQIIYKFWLLLQNCDTKCFTLEDKCSNCNFEFTLVFYWFMDYFRGLILYIPV